MKVRFYKLIFYCDKCGKETIFSCGEDIICECGNDFAMDICSFKSKDEYDEYLFFKDWKDESCANYVGYLKKMNGFNIIVSRERVDEAGLYDFTKVDSNVQSNSDPFGEYPEIFENKIHNLSLKELARGLKIKKIKNVI